MLAGISLVKAGDRTVGLIDKARRTGRLTRRSCACSPTSAVLPPEALLTRSPSMRSVAAAATESLDVLDQIELMEGDRRIPLRGDLH